MFDSNTIAMNTQEKQQFVQHWEKVRQRGFVLYVVLTGITWGTIYELAVWLVFILLDHDFGWAAFQTELTSPEFLKQWGIFLVGGLCYGLTMWFYFEWQYRRYKQVLTDEEPDL